MSKLKILGRLAAATQLLPIMEGGEELLVGGQAVIEGIMMRSPHSYCISVRKPDGELGDIQWYWSWVALALAVFLICLAGRYGRNYLGRKTIEWLDHAIMRVPLMNKIYGTVKQVNESFSSKKSSFKQVVLVSFPHPRSRTVGFVTGEQGGLGPEKLVSVFIPTTPNPTSGFLVLVPESEIIKLDMSVADGIKFIISLGAIAPDHAGQAIAVLPDSK